MELNGIHLRFFCMIFNNNFSQFMYSTCTMDLLLIDSLNLIYLSTISNYFKDFKITL